MTIRAAALIFTSFAAASLAIEASARDAEPVRLGEALSRILFRAAERDEFSAGFFRGYARAESTRQGIARTQLSFDGKDVLRQAYFSPSRDGLGGAIESLALNQTNGRTVGLRSTTIPVEPLPKGARNVSTDLDIEAHGLRFDADEAHLHRKYENSAGHAVEVDERYQTARSRAANLDVVRSFRQVREGGKTISTTLNGTDVEIKIDLPKGTIVDGRALEADSSFRTTVRPSGEGNVVYHELDLERNLLIVRRGGEEQRMPIRLTRRPVVPADLERPTYQIDASVDRNPVSYSPRRFALQTDVGGRHSPPRGGTAGGLRFGSRANDSPGPPSSDGGAAN